MVTFIIEETENFQNSPRESNAAWRVYRDNFLTLEEFVQKKEDKEPINIIEKENERWVVG